MPVTALYTWGGLWKWVGMKRNTEENTLTFVSMFLTLMIHFCCLGQLGQTVYDTHKLLKHLPGLESTLLSVSLYQLYAYNGPLCMHVSFSFILSTLLQNIVTLTKLWNKKWRTWTHSMVIFQNLVRCLQGSHFRHHRHTSDVKTAINYRQHNYAAL